MEFSVNAGTFKFKKDESRGLTTLYAVIAGVCEPFREMFIEARAGGKDFQIGQECRIIPEMCHGLLYFDVEHQWKVFEFNCSTRYDVTILKLGCWGCKSNSIVIEQIFRDYFEQHGLIEVAGG